jgi:hypothetical protein
MDIQAEITGIRYTPFMCKNLELFDLQSIDLVLSENAVFIVNIDKTNNAAISRWVSSKRTRSYPYARVYDSLGFSGKKVTIIPIMKDEGKEGDRDFLQWDTISLMSLLGVYVIIGYYVEAEQSQRYRHKITKQRFDIGYVKKQIMSIMSYQSDALHWNLHQVSLVGTIAQQAIESYESISNKLNVEMHSVTSAKRKVELLLKGKKDFMESSRNLAQKAQLRETQTIQPKEHLLGTKASITIRNYLGGYYYLTCDETKIRGKDIYLTEGKHSVTDSLPSLADIKDGLIRMILFSNLQKVTISGNVYNPKPVLKLTFDGVFDFNKLSQKDQLMLQTLQKEARQNSFEVKINQQYLSDSTKID